MSAGEVPVGAATEVTATVPGTGSVLPDGAHFPIVYTVRNMGANDGFINVNATASASTFTIGVDESIDLHLIPGDVIHFFSTAGCTFEYLSRSPA